MRVSRDSKIFAFMKCNFLNEDGSNFDEWERNLRLAVEADRKEKYIFMPPPPNPSARAPLEELNAYRDYNYVSESMKNVLYYTMDFALQHHFIVFFCF